MKAQGTELLPSVETDIGDVHYSMRMFDGETSLLVLVKLMKLIGPAIATGMSNGLSAEVTGPMLQQALTQLFSNMTHAEVKELVVKLLEQCEADGKPLINGLWKFHFAGKIGHMMRVLVWAVRSQYADFFADMGGLAGAMAEARAMETASLQTT
jgi:hypothetical protein